MWYELDYVKKLRNDTARFLFDGEIPDEDDNEVQIPSAWSLLSGYGLVFPFYILFPQDFTLYFV